MSQFKPMLCPNQAIKPENLTYSLLASYKYDGIRCIFKDGKMLSRSLKQFQNKQLWTRFMSFAVFANNERILMDGELYSPSISFNELSGIIRQLDCPLPEDLTFNCFDIVKDNLFEMPFKQRIYILNALGINSQYFKEVAQWSVFSAKEVENLFENALANGFEGLILKNPTGYYKCGRATIRENLAYKLKPFVTFDAKIIDVLQGTVVDPTAEKTTNELGYSRTSKLKEDRLPSGRASDFVVKYNGLDLKVSIAMTNDEKEEIWKNKNKYIGKWVEYKGMLVGSKDLPRHPVTIRMRDDRDE